VTEKEFKLFKKLYHANMQINILAGKFAVLPLPLRLPKIEEISADVMRLMNSEHTELVQEILRIVPPKKRD
jgi:hypothetical protein